QIEQLQSPRTIAGGGGAGRAEGAVVAAGRADADRRGLDEAVVVAAFQHETRHGGDVEQAGVHRDERVGELVGQAGAGAKTVTARLQGAVRQVERGCQAGAVGLWHNGVNDVITGVENRVRTGGTQLV